MAEFQPVRLVSKDGETVVIARDAQTESDLRYASGYRTADDQTNLEPSGPRLDNGKLVEAADDKVVSPSRPAAEAKPAAAPKPSGTNAGDASK